VTVTAFDSKASVAAGVSAGIAATLVEIPLWSIAGDPWRETLLRDARFTAAIVLGPSAVEAPGTSPFAVLLVASALHFALSIVYTIVYAILIDAAIRRPSRPVAIAFGAFFGLVLYAVNLYGFTVAFPWFAGARGWVTIAAHLAFGTVLAAVYAKARPRAVP
jgi:hypothetical protein